MHTIRFTSMVVIWMIFNLLPQVIYGQPPQGFFLDDWLPREISIPEYTEVPLPPGQVNIAITIDLHDTIARIPTYMFGDNANLWTGCMSDHNELMQHVKDRHMGVLRGPGGSISDVFFWNRNVDQRPADVPLTLAGRSEENWLWYGDRPYPWETWTMDVDSLYRIMDQVHVTGMITINYGYARYGTGDDPVANAAHMAAEWVRYDNGRSKFWEIGNEVFGSWEAGYEIDTTLNRDGQPQFINATLYGQHAVIFIDSMKAAAQETGVDIKIGLVMAESPTTAGTSWNREVALQAGEKADYYVVHSYFTPWNSNSSVETILNSYHHADEYISYVWQEATAAGKPALPVALTEYNIFAVGSDQPVSHVNGMHAVLVTGETIKSGYGAALRWDLANGWDGGNDHGMFSYGSEPGVEMYAPRPVFFHLYFMRRFAGDVLLQSDQVGAPGIVIYATAFSSGHLGVVMVNTAWLHKVVRLNVNNFAFGDRFYTYTLTGNPGEDFSRKVFINDIGNNLVAGGPGNYDSIGAFGYTISDEVKVKTPPLSTTFVLIEPGTRTLEINNDVTSVNDITYEDPIMVFPNPSSGIITISHIPPGLNGLEIWDASGRTVYHHTDSIKSPDLRLTLNLIPGIYILHLYGARYQVNKKLIIR